MAASHDGRGIVAAVVNRRRTLRLLLPSCAAIVATAVTAPSAGAAAPPQLSQALDAWTARIAPWQPPGHLDLERLYSANLLSGMIDARRAVLPWETDP